MARRHAVLQRVCGGEVVEARGGARSLVTLQETETQLEAEQRALVLVHSGRAAADECLIGRGEGGCVVQCLYGETARVGGDILWR